MLDTTNNITQDTMDVLCGCASYRIDKRDYLLIQARILLVYKLGFNQEAEILL